MVRMPSRAVATMGCSGDPRRPRAVPVARCGGGEGEVRRKWVEDGRGAVLTGEGVGDSASCANPAQRRSSSGRIWTRCKGGRWRVTRAPTRKVDSEEPGGGGDRWPLGVEGGFVEKKREGEGSDSGASRGGEGGGGPAAGGWQAAGNGLGAVETGRRGRRGARAGEGVQLAGWARW
jgi:hypothetical protein